MHTVARGSFCIQLRLYTEWVQLAAPIERPGGLLTSLTA